MHRLVTRISMTSSRVIVPGRLKSWAMGWPGQPGWPKSTMEACMGSTLPQVGEALPPFRECWRCRAAPSLCCQKVCQPSGSKPGTPSLSTLPPTQCFLCISYGRDTGSTRCSESSRGVCQVGTATLPLHPEQGWWCFLCFPDAGVARCVCVQLLAKPGEGFGYGSWHFFRQILIEGIRKGLAGEAGLLMGWLSAEKGAWGGGEGGGEAMP